MKYNIYYKPPYQNTEYVLNASSTHMMKTFVELLIKEKCHNIHVYEIIEVEKNYLKCLGLEWRE